MGTASIVYVIIGLLSVLAVFLVLRQSLQKPNKGTIAGAERLHSAPKPISSPKSPYRAISIVCGQNACAAVKAIGGKRFLVEDNDVPILPLTQCEAEKCACKYIHHEDQREDGDRRTISGMSTEVHLQKGNTEQRKKRGRRKSDGE